MLHTIKQGFIDGLKSLATAFSDPEPEYIETDVNKALEQHWTEVGNHMRSSMDLVGQSPEYRAARRRHDAQCKSNEQKDFEPA